MSNLFKDILVDTEVPSVYKELCKKEDKDGYFRCCVKDIYGNKYFHRHELIIAEGLQLPKHLWPKDEFGRRYVVDHIIPIKNGGTDTFSNLRLVPINDNIKNEMTVINIKNKNKKFKRPLGCFNSENALVKVYNYRKELENDGFKFHTVRKSVLRGNKIKGGLCFRYL